MLILNLSGNQIDNYQSVYFCKKKYNFLRLFNSYNSLLYCKDGGGRMDGKLTWIDDRQQLAIKTSQGWREIQVELISRFLELYLHW